MKRNGHIAPRLSRSDGDRNRAAGTDASPDRCVVIYREIHRALMEQRLPPGTRLPEEHLADIFGVSRTLVRQALLRLAHEHLVVQELNRGARVAEPTAAEVRHLYEVRRLIECAMLADVARRLSRSRISALKRLVANEAKANSRGDTLTSMQLAGQFHLELADTLDNPVLYDVLRELIARGNVAIALYELRERASCRCNEHRQIVRHLGDGDLAAATEIMQRHLSGIEDSLTSARTPRRAVDLGEILASAATLAK